MNAVARQSAYLFAMAALAEMRVAARVHETLYERRRQVTQPAEIGVIAVAFAGQYGMQRMVKVIAPLGIDAKPAQLAAADDARVIQIAFGDQHEMATEVGR